jgi:beige protein homolog 1
LIPEFFYLPNFLKNQNKFNFGAKQTGEIIDDVVLPKWAKNDPRLYISLHRQALECDYVSNNIHQWIDLIFGYKQQGEEAANCYNVFHYLSYEGAVDVENIKDPVEKQSTIGIIHNFGQTPKQLFKKPHPARGPKPVGVYRIETHCHLLMKTHGFRENGGAIVSNIAQNAAGQLVIIGPNKVFLPNSSSKCIEWGNIDNSIRIKGSDSNKPIAVFENLHIGRISAATFVDSELLVTGGDDTTVCIWNYSLGKKSNLELAACFRGHKSAIKFVAASRNYSIVVSAGEVSNNL